MGVIVEGRYNGCHSFFLFFLRSGLPHLYKASLSDRSPSLAPLPVPSVTMLQMAFPSLRNDNNLIAFNRKLDTKYTFDLRAWRSQEDKKGGSKELQEGFEVLDLDDGAPWELLCALMEYDPRKR